jgi:membrane fusion protein
MDNLINHQAGQLLGSEGSAQHVEELFRREVMEARSGSWLGPIRLAMPVSQRVWAIAAVWIAICVVMWLSLGEYARRVHVSGVLVPEAGLLTVTARAADTVSQVNVAEGSVVKEGDPLATLSGERSSVAMGDTSANISAQLTQQTERLQADMSGTQHLADQQAQDLRMQQTMLTAQVAQVDAQIAIEKRQAAKLQELLARFEPLKEKGFVSPLDVQQEETQEAEAESQVKALERERYDTQQKLMSAADQLEQLPLTTASRLSDLKGQIAQTQQSLLTNEADRSVVLRAPQDGVVSSILVKPGQALSPGEPILAMVPRGSPLVAQLFIPSSAVGFVRTGASVALHYEAFPYQKFGIARGVVDEVSRSALTPNEVMTLLGGEPPKESLYRVEVRLDQQHVEAYGRAEELKPGMALDADVLLEKRRIVEWIFEPLYGMARRQAGARS